MNERSESHREGDAESAGARASESKRVNQIVGYGGPRVDGGAATGGEAAGCHVGPFEEESELLEIACLTDTVSNRYCISRTHVNTQVGNGAWLAH